MTQDIVEQLFVNDGPLEPSEISRLKPSEPKPPTRQELRQSLSDNGYLYLKGLLPREDVLQGA